METSIATPPPDAKVARAARELIPPPIAGTPASAQPLVLQEVTAPPKPKRWWTPVVVLAALVGLGAPTMSFVLREIVRPSTNDAYVEGRAVRISPRVSGPVVALNIDDNSRVRAGDILLRIDPADFQARADQARAAVAVAESSVRQAEAAVLRSVAAVGEASAALGSAEADARRRASDYRRYAAMGTDGVSEQQLETARTAADVGDRQREAAEKKLAAANAELNVATVNVATARSQVAAAQSQLRFAELQLEYTTVRAPESGAVTKKNVELGSFVSTAQPLMAIVPDDCWVVANFKEVQLERLHVGQSAEIRVDAFPSLRLLGRVESIQAGTGSRFQLLPPENATGNWVKVVQRIPVKIVLTPGQPGLEALALGMSVHVRVDTRSQATSDTVALGGGN